MTLTDAVSMYLTCIIGAQAAKTFAIGFECTLPRDVELLTNVDDSGKRFISKNKLASEMLPFPVDLICATTYYAGKKLDDLFYKYHPEQRKH